MAGRRVKDDSTRPPENPYVGKLWHDAALGRLRRWDGKEWVDHATGKSL
jgi:hypothetical protein